MKHKQIDNFANWRTEAKKNRIISDSDSELKESVDLAFLIGLVLGDGNISKFPRVECLRLTLGTDKPQLALYAVESIKKVFNKTPSMIKRSNSNCYNVTLYQKNISKRLDIPLGSRGKLKIQLPFWIWKHQKYTIAILRGLFEAEASYCVHEPTYTYNFEFTNRNCSLLDEVERGLKILGYNPERRKYAVRLRKKAEAIRFRSQISFRSYP